MSSRDRYPRKGQFGDSTPRCQWCGIKIHDLSRFHDKNRGEFCSKECSAAGKLFQNVAILITSFVALVILLVIAFHPLGYIATNGYLQEDVLSTFIQSDILLVIMLVAAYYARLGLQVRAGPILKKPLKSEGDFKGLHRQIVEFLKEFPSNEGVAKKDVYSYLDAGNTPPNEINMAILELVASGYVKELKNGRYLMLIEEPVDAPKVDPGEYTLG